MMLSLVNLLHRYKTSLLIVFGLVLLAKGPAFLSPMYSIDAWIAASEADRQSFTHFNLIGQYRFGLAALFRFFRLFEFDAVPVAFSSVFLACGLAVLASLLAYHTIDPSDQRTPYLIFAAIFCLHPFTTEIFTFVDVTLFVNLALALGLFGGLLLIRGSRLLDWMIGAAFIVASLSIYQVALHYILITLMFAGLAALMRGEDLLPAARAVVISLVSAAVCLVIAKLIVAIAVVPSGGRGSFEGLFDIQAKIKALWDGLTRSFAPPNRLIPPVATWIAAGALVLSAWATAWVAAKKKGATGVALVVVTLVAAVFWIPGVAIMGKVIWLMPRVLSAVAVFIGGLLTLGWIAGDHRLRLALSACAVLLTFAYIASGNRILYDQWRVNQWDARKANRIVARLETMAGFSAMQTIVTHGGQYSYTAPLPTALGDMNATAFSRGQSPYPTFQQVTGYRLRAPRTEETAAAEDYCKNGSQWPEPQSVTILGHAGVVCLGPL